MPYSRPAPNAKESNAGADPLRRYFMNSSPQAASDERVSEPPVWGNTRSDERSGLNKNAGGEGGARG